MLAQLPLSLVRLTGLGRPPQSLAGCDASSLRRLLRALAVQSLGHLLCVALGVQGQQASEHVDADGIGHNQIDSRGLAQAQFLQEGEVGRVKDAGIK